MEEKNITVNLDGGSSKSILMWDDNTNIEIQVTAIVTQWVQNFEEGVTEQSKSKQPPIMISVDTPEFISLLDKIEEILADHCEEALLLKKPPIWDRICLSREDFKSIFRKKQQIKVDLAKLHHPNPPIGSRVSIKLKLASSWCIRLTKGNDTGLRIGLVWQPLELNVIPTPEHKDEEYGDDYSI